MTAPRIVVMGVSGCGKSAIGQRLAESLALPLVEGDQFHPRSNIEKMRQGLALDDSDRAGWLEELGHQLAQHPDGAVLTCSALKRAYRDRLRGFAPGLLFVHLRLTLAEALERVSSRGNHFYPPSLVASQFETLEDPHKEAGVFTADAALPLEQVVDGALQWLRSRGDADSTMRN